MVRPSGIAVCGFPSTARFGLPNDTGEPSVGGSIASGSVASATAWDGRTVDWSATLTKLSRWTSDCASSFASARVRSPSGAIGFSMASRVDGSATPAVLAEIKSGTKTDSGTVGLISSPTSEGSRTGEVSLDDSSGISGKTGSVAVDDVDDSVIEELESVDCVDCVDCNVARIVSKGEVPRFAKSAVVLVALVPGADEESLRDEAATESGNVTAMLAVGRQTIASL